MAFETAKDIIDDLKHSWYFRIWVVLWLVCAIVSFAGLIVLSNASEMAQKEPGFRVWTDFPEQLTFPNVWIFLQRSEIGDESISQVSCMYGPNNITVPTTNCPFPGVEPGLCYQITANTTVAQAPPQGKHNFYHGSDVIFCLIWTTANASAVQPYNTVLAAGIQDTRVPVFLGNGVITDVRLEVESVQYHGSSQAPGTRYTIESGTASNVVPNGANFGMALRFNDFRVLNFQKADLFNGWMGIGTIGGFAFFLYILHSGIMGMIGCFLPNTSKFLGGEHGARPSGYNNL